MNGERETPREIARGGPRLARTCLLGPPSFTRDRMPAYLIRFLTRCIRGCLHRVHVDAEFAKERRCWCGVMNHHRPARLLRPPRPPLPVPQPKPSQSESGVPEQAGGVRKVASAREGQTIVHIILLYGPRGEGGGGSQA